MKTTKKSTEQETKGQINTQDSGEGQVIDAYSPEGIKRRLQELKEASRIRKLDEREKVERMGLRVLLDCDKLQKRYDRQVKKIQPSQLSS